MDFARFARCLQWKLVSSLGSIEHKGVAVEALATDNIKILLYFGENPREARCAREWVEGELRRSGFTIEGIAPDEVCVSYSVSCSEQVVESFLRTWKAWMEF